jgi:twitching motility protein PilT
MDFNIKEILRTACEMGVSDIHLTAGLNCKFRLDGELINYGDRLINNEDTDLISKEMFKEGNLEMFNKNGEVDFSYTIENISRFRVNVFKQRGSVAISIRVVPQKIPKLHEIQAPNILSELMQVRQGLILVTGPTGSGKSTTLAAMIDYVNSNYKKHIITLEDPIEFVHLHEQSMINQREVGFDTQNFASGLRASLRQDPDIILVGEMRDLETISTAITAAETGHLVLGTLHTKDASSTVDRIIDVFPGIQQSQIRVQLSEVLLGVVSQRLLKTIGGGRIAAHEILVSIPAIRNMIRQEKTHQITNVLQTNRHLGMCTMEHTIKELVNKGLVDKDYADEYLTD